MINYFIESYFLENRFSHISEEQLLKKIREIISFPAEKLYLFDFNDINEIIKQHRTDLPLQITYTNYGMFILKHCSSYSSKIPERNLPKYPIFIDDLPVNKKLKKNYLVLS